MPPLFGLPSSARELPVCRDAVAELQGFLSNILMTLMPSSAARKKMRLTGISQPLLHDASVWYLWRDDFSGIFQLELGEADFSQSAPDTRPSARGRFWVKYFPALVDDPAFDALSVFEQGLRLSPLFDASGTPELDTWEHLPEAAFHVGYLELELQEDAHLLRLELSSQDFWRTHCTEAVDLETEKGTMRLLEAGEVDRNIPGWPLAWPVLDTLVTAVGLFYAAVPVGCAVWSYRENSTDAALPKPCTEAEPVHQRLLLYLPCLQRTTEERQPALWDVFDLLQPALDECETVGGTVDRLLIQPPDELWPSINPLWWLNSTDQDLSDAGLCCLIGHDTAVL